MERVVDGVEHAVGQEVEVRALRVPRGRDVVEFRFGYDVNLPRARFGNLDGAGAR